MPKQKTTGRETIKNVTLDRSPTFSPLALLPPFLPSSLTLLVRARARALSFFLRLLPFYAFFSHPIRHISRGVHTYNHPAVFTPFTTKTRERCKAVVSHIHSIDMHVRIRIHIYVEKERERKKERAWK